MISYATMTIAALIAISFFFTRFWVGVFAGGIPKRTQVVSFVGLALVPFVQVVTVPLLLLSGLVFFVLWRLKKLPGGPRLAKLEKDLDEVSFRAFAVGIPFLTAGVWMGAFWAQESWANYWGWDSKENTALITWLVYVVYIHLRMLGGYRGAKAMSVLVAGALSVFLTFQIFGYLPDSQKSLHRYTDDAVVPMEGRQDSAPTEQASARAPAPEKQGG
jgi:ABC-type transport system involved in cytochrome c biogenesis permease subunit